MPASQEGPKGRDSRQRAAIERALDGAAKRLRWRRALRGMAATAFLPALAGAAWVALSRFTLLEPPRWPVLLFPLAWIIGLLALALACRPSRAQSARFLDSALGLDARAATYVEMDGRRQIGEPVSAPMLRELAADAVYMLDQRGFDIPSPFHVRVRPWQAGAGTLAVAALLAAMLVPTGLDAIKAEKRVLDTALASQANQVAELRADLISRPGLPDAAKQALDDQLKSLEAQLHSGQMSRADALAAIAGAEDKVRSLMPDAASADFDPLIRAAQQVQGGVQQNSEWDPSLSVEKDDLGKAAEALDFAKSAVNQLNASQARGLAGSLERAADLTGGKDPELSQHLTDSGAALRRSDQRASVNELAAAEQRFRDAQKQEQTAEAVENTLSKLADGRQDIASAGAPVVKRQQLGFRRPDKAAAGDAAQATPGSDAASRAAATPGAGGQTGAGNLGQYIGQNQPAFGAGGGSTSGAGPASQGSGQPGNGGQPSNGQGGKPTGSSGAGAGAGGQGGQNGGPGTGGPGTQQGATSGPVRVGGASGGSNAAGFGVGTSTTGTQDPNHTLPEERIYVPGTDPTQRVGIGGQASPEQNANGVSGRVGDGTSSTSTASEPGLGQANNIRTPYTEVLGKYTQQATQSLDRAYVPPDAKEYVKNYFSALGK